MKVRFDALSDFAQTVFCELITTYGNRPTAFNPDSVTKEFEITVTIQGKEVDFREFVTHVESQLDTLVAHKAGELLQAKLDALSNCLYDVERAVKRSAREAIPNIRFDSDHF